MADNGATVSQYKNVLNMSKEDVDHNIKLLGVHRRYIEAHTKMIELAKKMQETTNKEEKMQLKEQIREARKILFKRIEDNDKV